MRETKRFITKMSEDKSDYQNFNSEEKRPEWMNSISGIVNPEDYLLGRKIDKTFELHQQEKAKRAKEHRANLIATDKLKLNADPILDLERRRYELKLEIISNPIRLKQFREYILKKERDASQDVHPNSKEERKVPLPVSQSSQRSNSNRECSRSRMDRKPDPSSSSSCSSSSSSSSYSSSSTSSPRFQRNGRWRHVKKSKRRHKRRHTERTSSHKSDSRIDTHRTKLNQKYRKSSRSVRHKVSGRHRRSRSRSSDRRDIRRHRDKRC